MMMSSRRVFLTNGAKVGLGLPIWLRLATAQALSQEAPYSASYKAVICISLGGGNDGNNMLVPYATAEYQQYARVRGNLALGYSSLLPLGGVASGTHLALHPSMLGIAALYNAGKASFVANVGSLKQPLTKAQLLESAAFQQQMTEDHLTAVRCWQSASTQYLPTSGWGGRIADAMVGQSGVLPMVLNASDASLFTVGQSVQGAVIQGPASYFASTPVPDGLQQAAYNISQNDAGSTNKLVGQVAQLSSASWDQQLLIGQAKQAGAGIQTTCPNTPFSNALKSIVQVINGRRVSGANRQIFYISQGNYDTHGSQLVNQAACLRELDSGLSFLMAALDEIGMTDEVLICTQSDFNRTFQPNSNGGSDHAWGNHQMILGGGLGGGRILGTMPALEIGGSDDSSGSGTWIPTIAVTQLAAAVASWMGLSSAQVAGIFPDLANFAGNPLVL